MFLFIGFAVILIAGGIYFFLQQRKCAMGPKSPRKEVDPPSTRTAVQGSIRKRVQKPESELNQRDLFAEFMEQEGSGKPSPATTPRKIRAADSLHATGGLQKSSEEAPLPAPSVVLDAQKESGSAVAIEVDPLPASIPIVPASAPAPDQTASPGIATAKQISDATTTDVVTAQSIASPIPTDPGTPCKDVQTAQKIDSPASLPVDVTQNSQQLSQSLEVEKTQVASTVGSSGEEASAYESGSKNVGKRRKMLDKKKASKNAASKSGSKVTATASSKKGKKLKKKKSAAKSE